MQNLILPLAACEHLGAIKAANCGLQDELPSLDPMPPTKVDRVIMSAARSYLASSLETLDLSGGARFGKLLNPTPQNQDHFEQYGLDQVWWEQSRVTLAQPLVLQKILD